MHLTGTCLEKRMFCLRHLGTRISSPEPAELKEKQLRNITGLMISAHVWQMHDW